MKLNKHSTSPMIAYLCVLSLLFVPLVRGEQDFSISSGNWVEYIVLDSSDTTNMFFGAWPPGDYLGNWSVSQNEIISYEITNDTTDELEGVLVIGNYIFENIRNIDVASALAISVFPWAGGFFANFSDWTEIAISIEETNTTMVLVEDYIQTINDTLYTFDVYEFNTENYYGQFSQFRYIAESGILLSAFTSFWDYTLNISLSSTNINLKSEATNKITFYFIPSVALILAIPYFLRRKQYRAN